MIKGKEKLMKRIRLIAFALLIAVCMSQLVSCGSDGRLYVLTRLDASEWISGDYIQSHKIMLEDKSAERSHTALIKDRETYDQIFYDEAPNVDFANEMVILHIRSSWGIDGDMSIDKVKTGEDGVARITVRCKVEPRKPNVNGASQPIPLYFILVVERSNATSASIDFVTR